MGHHKIKKRKSVSQLPVFWPYLRQRHFCGPRNVGLRILQRVLAPTKEGNSGQEHSHQPMDHYSHTNYFNRKPVTTGMGGRVGFPAKNFPR